MIIAAQDQRDPRNAQLDLLIEIERMQEQFDDALCSWDVRTMSVIGEPLRVLRELAARWSKVEEVAA